MRIPIIFTTALFAATLSAQAQMTPRTNDLIVPQTAASRILIPVAGDVVGNGGTHFRSDIDLINLRNVPQDVQLRWMPQGSSGASVPVRTITIAAQSGVSSENFVGEIMQQAGLGSIDILGVTGQGVPDSNATLQATARIWTPEPGNATATMSQTFPSIVMPTTVVNAKTIFGLRRSSQYRLNVGIVNPSTTTQRFRVTTYVFASPIEQSTFEIDLPPMSMNQVNVPGSASGIVQVLVENTTGGAGSWHAWASSVDNVSGDAWSHMAFGGS